jgi:hypothetical protein
MLTESVRVCRHVGSGCWNVICLDWDPKDLAEAQAVNRRPVAVKARVHVPAHSLWDFWRKNGIGSGFTASTSALQCHCHSIGIPHSISYYSCRKDKLGKSGNLPKSNTFSGNLVALNRKSTFILWSKAFTMMKLTLQLFWVMTRPNIVGNIRRFGVSLPILKLSQQDSSINIQLLRVLYTATTQTDFMIIVATKWFYHILLYIGPFYCFKDFTILRFQRL